ncbi:peptidase, M16 family [Candidatus Sumerlaea chitinivorans]|uniref:Peptidase, M16 family n=1 Tax=Sumerlaea chitinivorans TaxID=2250252 RepID=A0A2Z4Y6Z6_SUMC1|nr:peptidase, M16 family [Candidatus Sumerlaea chitinivorans]
MEQVRKIVLPNGVRIVLERIPYVRSASVGIWLEVGSRNEHEHEHGLSHFIEHMLFKGTRRKDALALSNEMNALGGNFNAFTTQENIVISAKVMDEHLSAAIDLLAEIYFESTFLPAEIDRERNVVLEEIKMYNDTPDELVLDVYLDHLYAEHSLGRPILGTPERVENFTQADILRYIAREFAPDRIVVAIAGNFDQRRIEPQLRRIFERLHPNGWERNPLVPPAPTYRSHNVDRMTEQVHFCMGTDGPPRNSEDRYAFAILSTILGGGTSSRIFQEVREKRGLAYSIGTFDCSFRDAGCIAVTGGTSPRNIHKVIHICLEQVKKLYTEGVTTEEVESARQQIKSSIILGMENSSTRMARLAECEIFFGEYLPVDDVIARLNAITPEDVQATAEKYLKDRPISFASIGPEKKFEPYLGGMTF